MSNAKVIVKPKGSLQTLYFYDKMRTSRVPVFYYKNTYKLTQEGVLHFFSFWDPKSSHLKGFVPQNWQYYNQIRETNTISMMG